MTALADDDEMTELVDADFPRVDLVGKGANGIPRFLVMKNADGDATGLLEPDFVRDLIAKAEPEPARERAVLSNGITLNGSPADIAAFIHKAAERAAVTEVPEEAAMADTVSKADMGPELDDGIDGMDPTVPLAEPDEMGAGDPTDPGSPAWESIDAATAQKWTSILARARVAVDILAEREMLEAASADPDDMCNAMDLQDVCSAIDYAIGVLAPFAVAEQSEADCGEADMMAMVGKSAGTDPAVFAQVAKAMGAADLSLPLQQLEYFGAVVAKSGRVLSSVNEAHIREASARLTTVLSSLPQAPITDDGQPVAKEQENAVDATETAPVAKADSAEAQAKNSDPVNAGGTMGMGTPKGGDVEALPGDAQTPGREVMKADGDGGKPAQVAVYDADGNLVGVANPDDITPLANVKAPASDDPSPDGAEAAPAPDPADMTPAPPAETGTPADAVDPDDVAKSGELISATSHLISPDALESIIAKAVAAALGAQAPAQDIAKQADVAGLSEQVETLKARLATVEEQPAAPKVFTNGAVPPAHQLRGQDQGEARPVDVAKALDLKHKMYTAEPGEAKQIQDDLTQMAIDQLAAIHRR